MPSARRRLRVPPEALGRELVEIVGNALRHLKVLRLGPGDRVALFDGAGTELETELLEVGADRAVARPCRRIDHPVESPLDLIVAQAVPVRLQRLDPVVRQLTELGVREFLPVLSRHGRGTRETVAGRVDRWRRIVDSAAEQCGRRRVMEVAEPSDFGELPWSQLPRPLLLLHPSAEAGALERALGGGPESDPHRIDPSDRTRGVTLLVGPEGGWSAEEVSMARDTHAATPVRLGPRILRADTAGVVGATVVLHRSGDLG